MQLRSRSSAILVFTVCLSILGTAPALFASDEPSPIRVSMQVEDPQVEDPQQVPSRLALVRGAYEVEIYGATALVTLAQEFHQPGEEEVVAAYAWTSEARHQPAHLAWNRPPPQERDLHALAARSARTFAPLQAWRPRGVLPRA